MLQLSGPLQYSYRSISFTASSRLRQQRLYKDKSIQIARGLDSVSLDGRETYIIEHRFLHNGTPDTLEAIGKVFGLTRERIRQLEKAALIKLRDPSVADLLTDFRGGSLS